MNNIFFKAIFRIKLSLADEFRKAALFSKYQKVNMGKRVRITGIPSFGTEPYLVTIGDDVTLTHGIIFHTHDGGVGIFRHKYPGINLIKPIKVGNNVFIGSNTTILPGVLIGDNVIIGASSVITKNIPDNVVVAGVPAKVIRSLVDYEEKALKEAIYITETDPQRRELEIKKKIMEKRSE